jgi:para-aminobenzoate synthetase component 2
MMLVIDNYDSFTYNLVQYLGELGVEQTVARNDKITLEDIETLAPATILISPGPCSPDEAGVSCDVLRRFGGRIPIFGVCLGHQCIGQVYGGRVVRADRLMHGKTSPIRHEGDSVLKGLPSPFDAIRYHSLIVDRGSLPGELVVTADTEEDEIMGLRHATLPIHGVQFHPESILTQHGKAILQNFLDLAAR